MATTMMAPAIGPAALDSSDEAGGTLFCIVGGTLIGMVSGELLGAIGFGGTLLGMTKGALFGTAGGTLFDCGGIFPFRD
jgi:uncharacterized protein GlcG (DUF336 family)